jgi:hypothetical protein
MKHYEENSGYTVGHADIKYLLQGTNFLAKKENKEKKAMMLGFICQPLLANAAMVVAPPPHSSDLVFLLFVRQVEAYCVS